ncbi:hypothetical protein BD626DRAFT_405682 [Schizophyllum amplum]|uniref:Pyridoxamine 5'-phosphate oxidase Alr4036 family FMN-binding domain-containing protein n=1 Tax=Schizophyllum amplum TaxID=97359 RepID=A0A550C9V7_9AGAR|nr:hypothetical protein BD626DRAFT_405682 [Auriculariopsis ampla]
MGEPQWKTSIAQALSQRVGAANRILQLTSIDASDSRRPYIRSLFFHSFISAAAKPSLPVLVAPVDIRTPKLAQLVAHPCVRLSWYIPETGEQYNISGIASILPSPTDSMYPHYAFAIRCPEANSGLQALAEEDFDWDGLRRSVYDSLEPTTQRSFASPRLPGSPVSGEEADPSDGAQTSQGDAALSNMGLLVVDPAEVEVLETREWPATRRTRFWRTREGGWGSELLV